MAKAEKWTLDNLTDQTGKTIIITGANTGLGFASARALSSKGAHVVIACRSVEKGEAAKADILAKHPDAKLSVETLDLANIDSIRAFAMNIQSQFEKIDVLLNNAGIMMTPFSKTAQGFELQIGTNHFGHFALTALLLPLIAKGENPRIVNVSSLSHKDEKFDIDNLHFESPKKYSAADAYSNSKLANLLFSNELQRKLAEHNIAITVCSAHPGVALTDLFRDLEKNFFIKLIKPFFPIFLNTPTGGALPQLRAATDAGVEAGDYYGPHGPGEFRGKPVRVPMTKKARNEELAKKLWDISTESSGVSFPFKKVVKAAA